MLFGVGVATGFSGTIFLEFLIATIIFLIVFRDKRK